MPSIGSKRSVLCRIFDYDWLSVADFPDFCTTESKSIPELKTSISFQVANNSTEIASCGLCNCTFILREEQTTHYRSDWHLHNLHLSLRGKDALNEEQFDQLVSEDEVSSESESEDDIQISNPLHRSPHLYFIQNDRVFSIYKRIVPVNRSDTDPLSDFGRFLKNDKTWIVILMAGGRFAAAVFCNDKLIVHKTAVRYTMRAKQGGSQSIRDGKQQNAPKSAGASLRRYNEQALSNDVYSILTIWKEWIATCRLVFLRCSTYHREIFTRIFDKNDPRIRTIPFATRRPTLQELNRVFTRLTTVYSHGSVIDFRQEYEMALSIDAKSRKKITRSKTSKIGVKLEELLLEDSCSSSEQVDDTLIVEKRRQFTREAKDVESDAFSLVSLERRKLLYTTVKTDDVEELLNLVQIDDDATAKNQTIVYLSQFRFGSDQSTFLHLTSIAGSVSMLSTLLQLDCDPTLKDKLGRVPYMVAQNRSVRQTFSRYRRQFPDRWDWNAAQVPLLADTAPVDPEGEARIAEKKRMQRYDKRQRDKAKKLEEKQIREEQEQRSRFLILCDREKRALAAERRQLQSSNAKLVVKSRCFVCAIDITGKVPFEYCNNRFCSMNCLKNHRARSDVES